MSDIDRIDAILLRLKLRMRMKNLIKGLKRSWYRHNRVFDEAIFEAYQLGSDYPDLEENPFSDWNHPLADPVAGSFADGQVNAASKKH